ncbi:hypothetical protein ACX1Q6_002248 [Enterococcus hirae]|nr:hypothetical protein [Enterococcus hirae]EMF0521980.1 hypothetical protein [Enterococcus hirae]BDX48161.1 hypothetical protein L6E_25750 [Enterococcus hirae]
MDLQILEKKQKQCCFLLKMEKFIKSAFASLGLKNRITAINFIRYLLI